MSRILTGISLALLTACFGGADKDVDSEPGDPQWYTTCGDPSCSGWSGTEGVDLCTDEIEGDVCDPLAATCDLQDECNALLICATSDPKDQEGGCPISLRSAKHQIRYLDAPQKEALAEGLLATPLATWRYRDSAHGEGTRLGFIIDDVPGSAAVDAGGQRVDLYGYTSMTVATVQLQQARIEALEAELAALRADVDALRSGLGDEGRVQGPTPR